MKDYHSSLKHLITSYLIEIIVIIEEFESLINI